MQLTAPPPAPQTVDGSVVFPPKADLLVAWFATHVTEMNTMLATLGTIVVGGGTATSYVFGAGITDVDPGNNGLAFDSATQNAATTIRADLLDPNGVDLTAFLTTVGASTNTVKGTIRLIKLADPTKFLIFNVSALATPSGYRNITVSCITSSSSSPFTAGDIVMFHFSRAGDAGATGAKGDPGSLGYNSSTQSAGAVTLTNASNAVQRVSATTWGQAVNLPAANTMTQKGVPVFSISNVGEYPMAIKDNSGNLRGFVNPQETVLVALHDISTAAGLWNLEDAHLIAISGSYSNTTLSLGTTTKLIALQLDTDRTMLLFGDTAVYAIVYTKSTASFGTATLVRSSIGGGFFNAIKSATDQVLVVSNDTTTGFNAVTLTTAAAVITVNTAATATLAGTMTEIGRLIAVGASWVLSYVHGGTVESEIRAFTISGTTVTIGAASIVVAASGAAAPHLYASGSVVLCLSQNGTNSIRADSFTVSGSTLSAGTSATSSAGLAGGFRTGVIGTRWYLIATGASSTGLAYLINLSGTVATMTTVTFAASGFGSGQAVTMDAMVNNGKLVIAYLNTTARINVLTDTAGTVSAGTEQVITGSTAQPAAVSGSGTLSRWVGADGIAYTVDASAATAVVTQQRFLSSSTAIATPAVSDAFGGGRNFNALTSSNFVCALPTAGTQLASLQVSANTHRVVGIDVMPHGTVGAVGADATESWVAQSTVSGGIFVQRVQAATPY